MSPKAIFLSTLFISIFFQIPLLFSGEIYQWADEKGTIYFTDDISKIPERYIDQVERIKIEDGMNKEIKKIEKPEEKLDPVKDYLEKFEKKIAAKRDMEKRISVLEEELRLSEERLKKIEEYEKEDYIYYLPFRDKRTGKWVNVATPFHEEKKRLKAKIDSIQAELKSIQERLSELMRTL